MKDPRVEKLARLMVEYSLKIQPGQHVLIAGPALAEPALLEVYRAAVAAGAHVDVDIQGEGFEEIFYQQAGDEQLQWVSPIAKFKIENLDALCRIRASSNTRALTGADAKKMAMASKARQPLMKTYMQRTADGEFNWVLTQWPCHASAQDADMSLADYEEFIFQAGHLDDEDPVATWKAISKAQQALTDHMNAASEVRIVAEQTDITYSCKGRKWINCDGQLNFPDGEVFTGPVEDSVNGTVRFSFPAVHNGREVVDAKLTFQDGQVVDARATKGEEFLKEMIAMDDGSKFLGEAAFGTNYNIKQYTRNTLFDEKIGGTIHLALGAAYPETGSDNKSGLHWDMVCDLRRGGQIYVDGELIQQDGRFLDKSYPQPTD
ncbi:MAG: aminopeptidase [Phycisphaerae bacterium]